MAVAAQTRPPVGTRRRSTARTVTEADVRGIVERAVESTVNRKLEETTTHIEKNSTSLMEQMLGRMTRLLQGNQTSQALPWATAAENRSNPLLGERAPRARRGTVRDYRTCECRDCSTNRFSEFREAVPVPFGFPRGGSC